MRFFLYVTYQTGREVTLGFPTLFERALHMILLASWPVALRLEDRQPDA